MSETPFIYHVEPEQKGLAVDILTAAFFKYPVMRYFLDHTQPDYEKKLRMMIGFFCETRLWLDLPPMVLQIGDNPVGAALLSPPTKYSFTPNLRLALKELETFVGKQTMDRLFAYENTCEEMEPEKPHYYLGMIGVLPRHQGQGYARLILDHVHQTAEKDPISTGVCLNTENPNNVPIYRHFGYEVTGETDVGPVHTWALFRPSTSR